MVHGFNPFSSTTLLHRESPSVVLPTSSPLPSDSNSQSYRSSSMYVDHHSPPVGDGTPQRTPPSYIHSSFALQDVVHQFRDQPELLQLILQSKVEEDKRRAEEAKLRAKEIDLLLQQRDNHGGSVQGLALRPLRFRQSDTSQDAAAVPSMDPTITPKSSSPPTNYLISQHDTQSPYGRMQPTSSPPHHHHLPRHTHSTSAASREHTPGALAPSHLEYRRHSAVELPPFRYHSPTHRLSSSSSESDFKRRRLSMDQAIGTSSRPQSPPADHNGSSHVSGEKRQRKRREMQSITKVVETRDFPYNDEYLWKNNGNTVHKGSGEKSIYYKCSYSSKGCPVNKTVTFKKNGEYVIKYRGEHLDDCNRVKRIVDV